MDFHCDGKVNYSEFLAATISTINFNKEEKLWSAFNYFDTTDSGYITLDSVMDALKNSGVIIDEEGLKKAFSELQKKGKKINFNEFKAIALGKEIVEEEYELIKEEEQEEKKKLNLKLKLNYNDGNDNVDQNNSPKKLEIIFEREEKKESQDIFFEKINFSNLNKDNNENKKNKENNVNDNKNEEENNKNGDINKNENSNLNSNGNSNANINNSNHKNNSKSNSKSNNNKSSKSNNKSSKSNNKSSKSNKSNMDILIEEQSVDDNNDKFTEVNEVQN